MFEVSGAERSKKGQLDQGADDEADQDGQQDRGGHGELRVLGLAGEVDGV